MRTLRADWASAPSPSTQRRRRRRAARREADEAVRIGPAPAARATSHSERIVAAARAAGAQAIHPGYGFLSENAAFARRLPRPASCSSGRPRRRSRRWATRSRPSPRCRRRACRSCPGSASRGLRRGHRAAAAERVGYPAAGQALRRRRRQGHARRRRRRPSCRTALAPRDARRSAAFGDDTLLVERYVETARHIEVQVLADTHGTVVHLGERECSPAAPPPEGRRGGAVAADLPTAVRRTHRRRRPSTLARSVGYTGAGTVEFIVGGRPTRRYFFLEMNTRLQVEHPVTELVTGLDLVELQLRDRGGRAAAVHPGGRARAGHAVEARVYAEDADHGFLPTGRAVAALRRCRTDVRVDSGCRERRRRSAPTTTRCWPRSSRRAPTASGALGALDAALRDTVLLGLANEHRLPARAGRPIRDVRAGRAGHRPASSRSRLGQRTQEPRQHVIAGAAMLLDQPADPGRAGVGRGRWRTAGGSPVPRRHVMAAGVRPRA